MLLHTHTHTRARARVFLYIYKVYNKKYTRTLFFI